MPLYDSRAVVPTCFYSLYEVQEFLGVSAHDLLRLASNTLIEVCVLVPEGRRAFAIDPGSTILWDSRALNERAFARAKPNKELGLPARKDDVGALILNWEQCQEVEDFGFSRQVLFESGYSIRPGRALGTTADPARVRPIRMPLYTDGGHGPADQSQWRFAQYRQSTVFAFVDELGYPEPEDALITLDRLRILGRELLRLPTQVDLSPLDVEVEFEDRPVVERNMKPSTARQPDEGVEISPRADQPGTAMGSSTSDAVESAPRFVSEEMPMPAGLRDTEQTRPDVIREARGPVVLLPREEVERRINKGKSWIYERISKKHRNYDPAFPQPIKIGGSVGWIEAEVEAWNQAQIRKARGPES